MDDRFLQGNVLAHTSSVLALKERLADPKTGRSDEREISSEPPKKATREKAETELKNKVRLGWAEREPTQLQKIVTTAQPNHLVQAHPGMDDSFCREML